MAVPVQQAVVLYSLRVTLATYQPGTSSPACAFVCVAQSGGGGEGRVWRGRALSGQVVRAQHDP